MDEILLLLLRKGAHGMPLKITTAEIGAYAGMSQQNASRRLAQLEKDGQIERSGKGIRLTKKAYSEMALLYSSLKAVFEKGGLEIDGVIVKGLGEGGYYLALPGYKSQIKEKLGFEPYPGTLNIKIDEADRWKRQHIIESDPIMISGFRDKERTYGDLFAYRCRIEGRECAIIIPLRTHHGPGIIELICAFDVKKILGKKEGDRLKVVI